MENYSDAAGAAAAAFSMPARVGPLSESLGEKEATCTLHGLYLSTGTRYLSGRGREVWTPCTACTQQREEEEREQREHAMQERRAIELQKMLGQAAIPARFIGRSFDNYQAESKEQQRAVHKCRAYAESFEDNLKTGRSLLLIGRKGTGKSHLASAILQALLPRHCGMYVTVADLIDMVRETWRRDSERTQVQVMNVLAGVPLLVVDEVGVQYGTDSEQNILFQVIDRRYREKKPMLILTNSTLAGVGEVLGDRVYDRLRECASAVPFEWDSYRTRAGEIQA